MTLTAERLAVGYPGKPVGADIDLAVPPGAVQCLLGPNGCGKTTLFKTLLGLLKPRGGRVLLDDRDLSTLRPAEIARRIAYVPQAQTLPFPYPAHEVVLMGASARLGLFSTPGAAERLAADAALDRLGIADLADQPFPKLSGGQRQLVLIARALMQETPLIVMDEPTASLDFGNQAVVLAEIARLAAQGVGVVLSTHDPDHAFALGGRVALMQGGRLIADGPAEAVMTEAHLAQVYGLPVRIARLEDGRRIVTALPRPHAAEAALNRPSPA